MNVTVAYYGIGNLLSVRRAFEHAGAEVTFADNAKDIAKADRLVVPGVGAFKHCMVALDNFGLREALIAFAATGRPYLGICVGMQMLMDRSFEFGEYPGLGLIPGEVRKIDSPGERVPFIGWKEISIGEKKDTFYFVHSYQALPVHKEHVLASYTLGGHPITAAVKKDHVMGVQFHPEKSAQAGIALIKDFLAL